MSVLQLVRGLASIQVGSSVNIRHHVYSRMNTGQVSGYSITIKQYQLYTILTLIIQTIKNNWAKTKSHTDKLAVKFPSVWKYENHNSKLIKTCLIHGTHSGWYNYVKATNCWREGLALQTSGWLNGCGAGATIGDTTEQILALHVMLQSTTLWVAVHCHLHINGCQLC